MIWDSKSQIIYPKAVSILGKNFPSPRGHPIGGFIQVTYFLENEVLQISPMAKGKLPSYFVCAINKWLPLFDDDKTNKSVLYQEIVKRAKRVLDGCDERVGWKLRLPVFNYKKCGLMESDEIKFPYWTLNKINGLLLSDFQDKTVKSEKIDEIADSHQSLVKFLAKFHQNTTLPKEKKYFFKVGLVESSLCAYYKNRLKNLRLCLNDLLKSNILDKKKISLLIVLTDYFDSELKNIVLDDEEISLIHGDFREDNIIVQLNEKKVWLLDFEQGLLGGDWLVDLWKFHLLDDQEKIKIFSSMERQKYLICLYCQQRKLGDYLFNFLFSNSRLLEKRIDLLRYDLFVSFLIFRYLLGWHFKEANDPNGRKIRGDQFVFDLLDGLIKRRLKTNKKA